MIETKHLLARLDEIAEALSKRKSAVALIGLGSVGVNLDRLDPYSDLDFFVIVAPGSKNEYLDDLDWLSDIYPVAYHFANTPDGFKLLYEDGVFCEFAVFEPNELKKAVFSPGRVIWKAQGVEDAIGTPHETIAKSPPPSTDWLVGEALTNLLVGLSREQRGEKLSAMRFIQGYAVDRVIELSERGTDVDASDRDAFDQARRYEKRNPGMDALLPAFLQGYNKNRESAEVILSYLDQHIAVNARMKEEILKLCK